VRAKPHYQKCLFAKAWPEPDLRYFSNFSALGSFSKYIAISIFHGLYFEVCGDLPALWSLIRFFRSTVFPMYR
jgi:hypothetical protein